MEFLEEIENPKGETIKLYKSLQVKESFESEMEKDKYTRVLEERIDWLENEYNIKHIMDEYKNMKLEADKAKAEAEYSHNVAQKAIEQYYKANNKMLDMYGD